MRTVLAISALMLAGCGATGGNLYLGGSSLPLMCPISSYGNGVYYFECASGFGTALAAFLEKNKLHGDVSFAPLDQTENTRGYYVWVKQ